MKRIIFVSLLAATASAAMAGTILLSSDVNIGNALDGSFGAPPANNATFFINVLGSGTKVFLFDQTSPVLGGSIVAAETATQNFYAGRPGVTVTSTNGSFSAANLSGTNLFIAYLPDVAFSGTEISALSGFLSAGGTAFFLGDNSDGVGALAGDSYINSALLGLGSGLSIVPDVIDACCWFIASGAQIAADPLTAGVSSYSYSDVSRTSGGKSLVFASGNQPILAAETGTPEPASAALIVLGMASLFALRRLHV